MSEAYAAECSECGEWNLVTEVIVEPTDGRIEPTSVELVCGHVVSLEDEDGA